MHDHDVTCQDQSRITWLFDERVEPELVTTKTTPGENLELADLAAAQLKKNGKKNKFFWGSVRVTS